MTDPLTCEFIPAHEPWTCRIHNGIRTSLDEPRCDIARPAEPFNDAYLDNIRQGIAEGRSSSSRYITRRLLATLDAERERTAALVEAAREWFASKCPVDWTEDDHIRRPTVNTANSNEARLAKAFAALEAHDDR